MNNLIKELQKALYTDFSIWALKVIIIAWACISIGLALSIDNKWILAGILAYEVLP